LFFHVLHKQRLLNAGLLCGLTAAAAALLVWPEAVSAGVSRGLSICGAVIIPSLFPFLVLAGFLVRAGIAAALGRRSERLIRLLFGLPGCCGTAILIGMVGGYPAGGTAVGELVASGAITAAQGRRLLRFCVNGGPAFIISAVGAGMLGSASRGALLFAAHIAVSLLIGIASRSKSSAEPQPPPQKTQKLPVTAAFVESVNAACRSLLYMCGFVVLFAALLTLADVSGAGAVLQRLISAPLTALGGGATGLGSVNWLPMGLEVSSGCIEAASGGRLAPLLLGITLGWGGLSVHCQMAASLAGQKLIDRRFFRFRLLAALLGGLVSLLLFRFVPVPGLAGTVPAGTPQIRPFTTSAAGSVALLLMCGMYLGTIGVRSKWR